MPADTPFPTSSTVTRPSGDQPESQRGVSTMSEARELDLERDTAHGAEAARSGAATAEDLIGRVAQSAHSAIDRLAEGAVPHVSRLQETMAGAGESLHAGADRARELSDEWAESLRCTVRENPLASIGVALAVGLLLARLAR